MFYNAKLNYHKIINVTLTNKMNIEKIILYYFIKINNRYNKIENRH